MVFKLYERDTAPAPSEPSVTIQKRGLISLNNAAAEQLGNLHCVERCALAKVVAHHP